MQTPTRPPSPRVQGGVGLAGGTQRRSPRVLPWRPRGYPTAATPDSTGTSRRRLLNPGRGARRTSSLCLSVRQVDRKEQRRVWRGVSPVITGHLGGVRPVPAGGKSVSHGRLPRLLSPSARGKEARPQAGAAPLPGRWGRCRTRVSPKPWVLSGGCPASWRPCQ